MIKATTACEAWDLARRIADAGTPDKETGMGRIYDHGDRLEITQADGTSTIIRIEPENGGERTAAGTDGPRHYGSDLARRIRETAEDFKTLPDFDRFVLDNGYRYGTREELYAGYDRRWKADHGILVTLEEFLAEAGKKPADPAADTYFFLERLVAEKKLRPGEVLGYARYGWCLNRPDAVAACRTGRDEWTVNNCGTEIGEERAKAEIHEEWGFDPERVRVIGTPYYDATDWQYIRFDCAHMTWLWHNGSISQVWE